MQLLRPIFLSATLPLLALTHCSSPAIHESVKDVAPLVDDQEPEIFGDTFRLQGTDADGVTHLLNTQTWKAKRRRIDHVTGLPVSLDYAVTQLSFFANGALVGGITVSAGLHGVSMIRAYSANATSACIYDASNPVPISSYLYRNNKTYSARQALSPKNGFCSKDLQSALGAAFYEVMYFGRAMAGQRPFVIESGKTDGTGKELSKAIITGLETTGGILCGAAAGATLLSGGALSPAAAAAAAVGFGLMAMGEWTKSVIDRDGLGDGESFNPYGGTYPPITPEPEDSNQSNKDPNWEEPCRSGGPTCEPEPNPISPVDTPDGPGDDNGYDTSGIPSSSSPGDSSSEPGKSCIPDIKVSGTVLLFCGGTKNNPHGTNGGN